MKALKKSPKNAGAGIDVFAERIAAAILSWQRSLAEGLNRRLAAMDPAGRWLLLIVFCLVMSGMNIYILIQSII